MSFSIQIRYYLCHRTIECNLPKAKPQFFVIILVLATRTAQTCSFYCGKFIYDVVKLIHHLYNWNQVFLWCFHIQYLWKALWIVLFLCCAFILSDSVEIDCNLQYFIVSTKLHYINYHKSDSTSIWSVHEIKLLST